MTNVLSDDEIAVGDLVSAQLEKMWGWYLAAGIIAMIFGFFVISYRHASVYAIVYLASGFFIVGGLFELIGGLRAARQRWPLIIFGLIWIGAGIVGFVWPHITIFIVAILVGWGFLVLGIFDIAVRGVGEGKPSSAPVQDVMSADPVTIQGSADVFAAFNVFKSASARRLPVLENKDLAGIISVDDLLLSLLGEFGAVLSPVARELMHPA